jgi:DNA mismatch endonuclease (patch repair protein)
MCPVGAQSEESPLASAKSLGSGQSAPRPLNETVRRQMSAMPTRDTAAEIALRRELHRIGLRFRTHLACLPGRPDVAFTRARLAVFVDGCFWHRCPIHASMPKNNSAWWAAKLEATVERDLRKDDALRGLGWLPVHVWEHEDPVASAQKITEIWEERTANSVSRSQSVTPL